MTIPQREESHQETSVDDVFRSCLTASSGPSFEVSLLDGIGFQFAGHRKFSLIASMF